jgi:hypothetical protein
MRIISIILLLFICGCYTCYISRDTTFTNDPNRIGVWYYENEWKFGEIILQEGSYEFYRTTNSRDDSEGKN